MLKDTEEIVNHNTGPIVTSEVKNYLQKIMFSFTINTSTQLILIVYNTVSYKQVKINKRKLFHSKITYKRYAINLYLTKGQPLMWRDMT